MNKTKIVHAVADYDEQPYDSTSSGKEILVQTWYMRNGGWDYLLVPPDDLRSTAEAAVKIGIAIATNNAYGYSKDRRWTGYKEIVRYMNAGLDVASAIDRGKGDFDCSSLAISCWKLAGLPIPASGYTGSMLKTFKDQGFSVIECPFDDSDTQMGALWLTPKKHTAMSINDGDNYDPTPHPKPVPVDVPYVEVYRGKVNVRKAPSVTAGKWRIDGHSSAHAIKRFPYIGSVGNGVDLWLAVFIDDERTKTGYISYAPKMHDYVRLVEE